MACKHSKDVVLACHDIPKVFAQRNIESKNDNMDRTRSLHVKANNQPLINCIDYVSTNPELEAVIKNKFKNSRYYASSGYLQVLKRFG